MGYCASVVILFGIPITLSQYELLVKDFFPKLFKRKNNQESEIDKYGFDYEYTIPNKG